MNTIKRQIAIIILCFIFALIAFVVGLWIFGLWHNEWSGYNAGAKMAISDGLCNIAVMPILGNIIPYAGADNDGSGNEMSPSINPDDFLEIVSMAERDKDILGFFLRIDSGGGSPVASETIANAVKNISLPTVALIREIGASGAYLIATGADGIIASPFSDIGSIGMTMSYLENTEKNAKNGLRYVSLASARFKDYGSPDKPLTFAERSLLERDLKIYHDHFVKMVSKNRNLPIEQVAKIADGSSMPGALALENKLIDFLGDQETARDWFAEKLEISSKEVIFCE